MKEADLWPQLKTILEATGWEHWQEVTIGTQGKRIDCVARKGTMWMAIELKTNLGFPLLEQCLHWTHFANLSAAVVPKRAHSQMAVNTFRKHGIGVMELDEYAEAMHRIYPGSPWIVVPKLHRNALTNHLAKSVHDCHRENVAGATARDDRQTPFKNWMQGVVDMLRARGFRGATTREIWDNVPTHLSGPTSVHSTLKTFGGEYGVKWVPAQKGPGRWKHSTGEDP